MAEDITITRQLDDIATKLEEIAGISPGALRNDITVTARLARIAAAVQGGVLESHAIGAHLDTTLGEPVAGHILEYDGADWINKFQALDTHGDVALGSLVLGDLLRWNGVNWANQSPINLIGLADLNDIDDSLAPSVDGTVLYWDSTALEWKIKLATLWSQDHTFLINHADTYASSPYTGKILLGNVTDWIATSLETANKNAGFIHEDGTIPLVANWNAGTYTITVQKFIADNDQDATSHDTIFVDFDATETASAAGRVYRGFYMDLDYEFNVPGATIDTSIVRGIEIDIDMVFTDGAASIVKPQMIKGIITGDATGGFGEQNAEQPVYMLIESNKANQSFPRGAYYFGVTTSATSAQCVSTRSFISGAGSGRLIAYQGYVNALNGETGEIDCLYAFMDTDNGANPARIVGVLSEPRGFFAGDTTNDKIMAFKGQSGHTLLSSGSLFVTDTTRTDLSVFATTHLTHDSFDGDIYAEGDLEIDGTIFADGDFEHTGAGANLGFFGVGPAAQAAAYTQTYSTADRTLGAYVPDDESGAYTGIDKDQAGTPYAQLTDLNALRTAYENLRAFTEDAVQMLNALVDDQQGYGLIQ